MEHPGGCRSCRSDGAAAAAATCGGLAVATTAAHATTTTVTDIGVVINTGIAVTVDAGVVINTGIADTVAGIGAVIHTGNTGAGPRGSNGPVHGAHGTPHG